MRAFKFGLRKELRYPGNLDECVVIIIFDEIGCMVRLNVVEFPVVILLQSSNNVVEICSSYLKLTFMLVTPNFVNK